MLLKQGVWYNPHKFIRKLMPGIDAIFKKYNVTVDFTAEAGEQGLECIVTSCGDTQHSIDSMHHLAESKAIDIRPPMTGESDIWNSIKLLLQEKGEEYRITYIILDERDHWHIQVKE